MFIPELLLSGLLVLGASTASPGNASTRTPASTGRLHLTFTERSPLSAVDVVLQRMDYKEPSVQLRESFEYELSSLSFEVFVPSTYRADVPHGLFVWMGVTDVPPAWLNVLARNRLILIAANTRKGRAARYGPSLDAVHNIQKLYNIDAGRVYASGFSAGGCVAMMMVRGYPEVFHGGLLLMGGYFYHSRQGESGQREPTVEGTVPTWKGPLEEIKKTTKLVMMKGERDTQWTALEGRSDYAALRLDGFTHIAYLEVPGLGHVPPNARWFGKGVDALEHSEPLTPPVTSPTTEPNPSPDQIAQARRILATAQYYLELKLPPTTQEMQDRLRQSYRAKALKYLQQVQEQYPTTLAAARASEMLHGMGQTP